MKKLYFFILLALCFSNNSFAQIKDGRIVLVARASGLNEIPAVNTKGKGLITFTIEQDYETVTVNGVVDSLSGAVSSCHIHQAAAGVNGGVIVNLISMVKGNRIYGTFKATKAQIAAMMTRNTYFNAHTAANPAGEIRGQLILESDLSYAAGLIASSEVPAVNNPNAWGFGSFTLSNTFTYLEYKVAVTGLTGPITSAHLHYGVPGRNGAVAFPLTFNGKYLTGTITVTNAFLDSLFSNKVYANIHTAANPGGEIRGQLALLSFVAADADAIGANEVPAVTSPARGLMFAYPNFTLDTIKYYAVYDSITPNAAHIHIGAQGVNGGVLANLTPIAGARGYFGEFGAKPDTMAKFLKGELYMNLHSTLSATGEIRGQLNTTVRDAYVANLCAGQEVPAVTSAWNAAGAAMISMDRNRLTAHLEILASGLTANATAAHIHKGVKGVNGPVTFNFGATFIAGGNSASGYASLATFSTTFLDSITNGQTYFNVHTPLNAGGEIRGQIGKTVETICIPTGTYEVNGQQLSVKVFPNPMSEAVTMEFEAAEDFDGQIVVTDLVGRSVLQKNQNILRGANTLNLNTLQLSNGVYFIQLKKDNQMLFSEKVVKQ